MKLFVFLCVLSLVATAMADTVPYPRGCIYIMGRCSRPCPEGTHAYTTGCSRKLPEATCDVPVPVLERGILCDYSACYCDPPTVRDTTTDKCVPVEQCPKKENLAPYHN